MPEDLVQILRRLSRYEITDEDADYIDSAADGAEIETPPKKKIRIIEDTEDDEDDLIGI